MNTRAGERRSKGARENGSLPCTLAPLLLSVLLLTGCVTTTAVSPTPTPLMPTAPLFQPTPTLLPATATLPDSGWQLLRPGLEHRTVTMFDAGGSVRERITALRLDPVLYAVSIAYHPGAPQPLADWQAETGALLVVNGGFFTPEYLATGRIVVDGQASGASYEGFGGMLAISEAGVEVRALAERPYSPDEPLRYALQTFPMLVRDGAAAYSDEDGQAARRTAVGMDGNGRLLFIFAPLGRFSLTEFSQFLAGDEWGLVSALNLDGGTSTGLLLADPPLSIPAFVPLPAVIVVEIRE